jgi:CBS domain-containing protein
LYWRSPFNALEGEGTMKLAELLNLKDFKYRTVVTVGLSETIFAAIQKLSEHDRGSLPVCNSKGELVGIITERDIVRTALTRPDASTQKLQVKDVMSTQIIIGSPDDDLSYAIKVMKERRIRHLPIVDKLKVIGMISMRDLLGVQLEKCQTEARYLSDYVYGKHRLI